MKDLLLRARVVVGTSNSSFSRLRHKFASNSESHVQHDYFSSLNQSNHWFVMFLLPQPLSFLKFSIIAALEWVKNDGLPLQGFAIQ